MEKQKIDEASKKEKKGKLINSRWGSEGIRGQDCPGPTWSCCGREPLR